MTSTLKLYGGVALLLLLSVMAFSVIHWDNKRLAEQYTAGQLAERAVWVAAQADANTKAVTKGNTDTLISEKVADQARVEASTITAASTAANQTTVEKITYAYAAVTPTACNPDVPLPAGVLEGLREARFAALGNTSTTSGGLQSTKRR